MSEISKRVVAREFIKKDLVELINILEGIEVNTSTTNKNSHSIDDNNGSRIRF